MKLPIQFPDASEVIRAEVARFRALAPEQQIGELDDLFRTYQFLRANSGRAAAIDQLAEAEENAARRAILEFAKRHG